jgi:AbrB family looped-hinge helix DNA binding protein
MADKSAVVDERGRIVIPQHLRDTYGISPGTMINFREGDGEIVLMNGGNARERLLAAFAEINHSMADRLVAERQEP